jgi:hypothetical protein
MKSGKSGLYNADTPDDATEQAIEWATEYAYEFIGGWSDVTVDKVELL